MQQQEKIWIFAGTTEGRRLYEQLRARGVMADVSVATDYGKSLLDETDAHVLSGRLDGAEMERRLQAGGYTLVVDATHPYATAVTQNIKTACEKVGVTYLRLLRKAGGSGGAILCQSLAEAVDYLAGREGNILSTIGSKELAAVTRLPDYENRVFARILPLADAVAACTALGFKGNHLIGMQGPFSVELNIAMLKQYHCRFLLTKNGGDAGGLAQKLLAAETAGVEVVLIDRPTVETGLCLEEVLSLIEELCGCSSVSKPAAKTHFPLFTDLTGKTVLVVGGGAIAQRRIETLCKFTCEIRVVAPSLTEDLVRLVQSGRIAHLPHPFLDEDLAGISLAVSATNQREVNYRIGVLAKEKGIPVSVADCAAECSFFFPAVITTGEVVIGVTGNGHAHYAVSQTADKIRGIVQHEN